MDQPKIKTLDNSGEADILKVILAIFLPPVGVLLEVGLTKHFWINVLLTLLGFIPGLVHAVWIIAKK
ncbi:MAG: YqaE/Pmp3 family membrane protein [Bdellovibrionales bacterium]|nr:YqaE/Pmp3 family membrane protein [Bdellovibrionales bacterium]